MSTDQGSYVHQAKQSQNAHSQGNGLGTEYLSLVDRAPAVKPFSYSNNEYPSKTPQAGGSSQFMFQAVGEC